MVNNTKRGKVNKKNFKLILLIGVFMIAFGVSAQIQVPDHAKLNYLKTSWVCSKGYFKSGKRCSKVKLPKNATLNYSGNSWICKKGFTKKGTVCSKIKIPKNAKLNSLGKKWECNIGFKLNGNTCKEMTKVELIQALKTKKKRILQVMRYASEDPCDRAFNKCKSECSYTIYNDTGKINAR